MKYGFLAIIILFLIEPAFSQDVSAKRIEFSDVPMELKNPMEKFIRIMNGEIADEMKSLYAPEARRPTIEIPADYPAPKKEKRQKDSMFEIQRIYVLSKNMIVMVYGVVGTQIKHDSTTALWVGDENSWNLMKYGMSMSDTLRGLPAKIER